MSATDLPQFDPTTKIRIAVDPAECDHPLHLMTTALVLGVKGCYCGLCATRQDPCPHPSQLWIERNAYGVNEPPTCRGCGKHPV